jgi:hypothetical protein
MERACLPASTAGALGLPLGQGELNLTSATRQPRMNRAACSPTSTAGAFVLPVVTRGSTDASATRSPSRPCTASVGSTTAEVSVPIRHVPTWWW